MFLKEKINLKYYLVLTVFNFMLFYFQWSKSTEFFYTYLGILISAILNHYFLFAGSALLLQRKAYVPMKGLKVFAYFIGKSVVLMLSFYIASKLIPKDILYAVLLYIFQLIILVISIKKSVIQKQR